MDNFTGIVIGIVIDDWNMDKQSQWMLGLHLVLVTLHRQLTIDQKKNEISRTKYNI